MVQISFLLLRSAPLRHMFGLRLFCFFLNDTATTEIYTFPTRRSSDLHGGGDRQAADELRDQAVLHQVLRQDLLEQLAGVLVQLGRDRRAEADALVADAPLDHLVEVGERPAADEQDV